jgi:acetyl-CoA carboxylase, biotin carboxylase subunit
MIQKILVANRGEIAIRVMRSAREMKIKTVAVFSDADRNAPHVQYADEAVHIGPAPSNESYLNGERIIQKAKELNVDTIHPGYGFLSENAAFAKAVKEAGMIFIGPDEHAIRVMGSKLAAKAAVSKYDIQMIPGMDQAIRDIGSARKIAAEIGFPILIKASAGGGGKGMRIVESENDFEEQMNRAVSEAESAFADGSVFIEKYIASPRHIEIQILADRHDNVIHLFERECSIQRRHQKVIEEAPSSILNEDLRSRMGRDAVNVAKSCNYTGAGTVEFLVDAQMNYYFLEMNTRLQVEHPVTEFITGIDLVKAQIDIANGKPLKWEQEDLKINGHAIELRVYAEDPENGFLPDIGTLKTYQLPNGPGVRVDDGYMQGMEIPIYYDPMISKLIAYGKNREEAIARMLRAIDEYQVSGVQTTLPFGRFVMQHEAFISGRFNTHFVAQYFNARVAGPMDEDEAKLAATIALKELEESNKTTYAQVPGNGNHSKWQKNRLEKY